MTSIHSFVQTAALGGRAPTQNGTDQGDDFTAHWLAEDATEGTAKNAPVESPDDPVDVAIRDEEGEIDIPIQVDGQGADAQGNELSHPNLPNDQILSVGAAPHGTPDVTSRHLETPSITVPLGEDLRVDDSPIVDGDARDNTLSTTPTDPSGMLTGNVTSFGIVQTAVTAAKQVEPTTHVLDQPITNPETLLVAADGTIGTQPIKATGVMQPQVMLPTGHKIAVPKEGSVNVARENVTDIAKPTADQRQTLSVAPRESPSGALPIPTQPPMPSSPLSQTFALLPIDADEPRLFSTEQGLLQSAAPTSFTPDRASVAHPFQAHAQQVAQQIATATVQSRAGSTEIALNPEELGRVRMTLTTTEAGITVSIIAERPETADLMRRNIELLMREFRDFGYGEASFSFDEQADGSDQGQEHAALDQADITFDDQAQLHPTTTVALRGGLDLKL